MSKTPYSSKNSLTSVALDENIVKITCSIAVSDGNDYVVDVILEVYNNNTPIREIIIIENGRNDDNNIKGRIQCRKGKIGGDGWKSGR